MELQVILLSILSHSLLLISLPSSAATQTKNLSSLFIFGDSYFDPGNNNYINTTTLDQANFWPYGETYFKYPTGRFSNGRLISDFISEHARLPLIPPYLQHRNHNHIYHGVNFASAGAGALKETFQGSVIDLQTQLQYYELEVARLRHKLGDAGTRKVLSNAVYLFSIGTNDYTSRFLLNSATFISLPHLLYVQMVIGNFTDVLKAIYDKGGRKFMFMNLGDLGCFPGLRNIEPAGEGGCLEEASALATLHNIELSKILVQLELQLDGFKYFLYDFNAHLAQKIDRPDKYGFVEVTSACCGTGPFNGIFSCGGRRVVKDFEVCENPNKFIFWDSYHLTEKVYEQMTDQMWRGDKKQKKRLKNLFQRFSF